MIRPFLLACLIGLAPAVMLGQARPSTPDQANDAFTENAGLTPAPPIFAPIGSTSGRSEAESGNPGDTAHTIRISGGVMAGQLVNKVYPAFSPEALAKGCGTPTVFSVIIGTDGAIRDIRQTFGPACDGSALQAVRQWTYRPYLLNGKPVAVSTTVTLSIQHNAGAESTPQK